MIPENWKSNKSVFLIENDHDYSYHDLYISLCSFFPHFKQSTAICFILESNNSFLSYSRFLAALAAGKTVLLASPAQFKDNAYLELLAKETGFECAFLSLNAPLSLSSKAEENKNISETFLKSRFIVRTSGSSGMMFKLIEHSTENFFSKYEKVGPHFEKTYAFSPAESIAGIETLLEVLFHQKSLVTGLDLYDPVHVCSLLKKYKVDYFQTTPTFLSMMIISKQLSSELNGLQKIAYGSEPSLLSALNEFKKILPDTELMHTYGMSEIGILKTLTDIEDPTRFVPDEHYNPFKIVEGLLQVQSLTRMNRYLNAVELPSPLGKDWFNTNDRAVLEKGYLKVIGRSEDLINIGGRKFYPIELENLLMNISGVQDVTILSEKNEMIGSVITAVFVLNRETDEAEFRKNYKSYCRDHIVSYMHPHKIRLEKDLTLAPRMKKMRKS